MLSNFHVPLHAICNNIYICIYLYRISINCSSCFSIILLDFHKYGVKAHGLKQPLALYSCFFPLEGMRVHSFCNKDIHWTSFSLQVKCTLSRGLQNCSMFWPVREAQQNWILVHKPLQEPSIPPVDWGIIEIRRLLTWTAKPSFTH